jgi:phenylacetate-CoA ligase
VPSPRGASLLALLFQLERTQWWARERLEEHQLRQALSLLRHAHDTVPFYRERFAAVGYRPAEPLTWEAWRSLPLLTRVDIQGAGTRLSSERLPPGHGPTVERRTSGGVGQPVHVRASQLDLLMWEVMALRDHLWHGRDFSRKLAVIRPLTGEAAAAEGGLERPDWGAPASAVFRTGPGAVLNLSTDVAAQAAWLKRHDPDYLITFPNNLLALIEHFAARDDRPRSLREVRTVSEAVSPALRAACREAWGVPLTDSYSSQETGYIALQCPRAAHYHVMAECVIVEILAEDGRPCAPGETGRVVVTCLHNFAMPLIRYELRDYAEAGGACACGRGLPMLSRILGRSRNMVTLPDGSRHWPLVGGQAYRDVAPVRQFQLVQHALDTIEVRLVVERALAAGEEARLARIIQSSLGYPFTLRFSYVEGELPRSRGGKFEEFVSRLA